MSYCESDGGGDGSQKSSPAKELLVALERSIVGDESVQQSSMADYCKLSRAVVDECIAELSVRIKKISAAVRAGVKGHFDTLVNVVEKMAVLNSALAGRYSELENTVKVMREETVGQLKE